MMKKILLILGLTTFSSFSQSTSDLNRNNIWGIGDRLGNTVINFNSGTPQVSTAQSNYGFSQNSSAICDVNGQELIISNGIRTLNKNL